MSDADVLAGLNPPAAKFASDYLSAFPDGWLASGRRSIDGTATVEAQESVANRAFILETYSPSGVDPRSAGGSDKVETKVKCGMLDILDANPTGDQATLASLFANFLGSCTDEEISHFSAHPSGNAVDLGHPGLRQVPPVGDPQREAWAQRWVSSWIAAGHSLRSRVLDREAGEPKLHGQIYL